MRNQLTNDYRVRSLGGSLLVIKGLNDCVTIERGSDSKPKVVRVEGAWTGPEVREAMSFWRGSEAQAR